MIGGVFGGCLMGLLVLYGFIVGISRYGIGEFNGFDYRISITINDTAANI
jgi:LytS/YehU family sensor histidine kinase